MHINRNTCISHSPQKFSVPATDDDRKQVHAIRNIKIKELHDIDDGTAVALKALRTLMCTTVVTIVETN